MKHTALLLACVAIPAARASDLIEVSPLRDRVVLLHFKDGRVVHHRLGQKRGEETVAQSPLDVGAAAKPDAYRILSRDDPAYRGGLAPTDVGRKSKGTDFSWHVDRWENGRAVNDSPDHTKEHWVALFLPRPLTEGKSYAVSTGSLASNGRAFKLLFSARKTRSESIHANTIGYAPAAPAKFAYVYDWIGDRGGMDVRPLVGRRFWLVDQTTGRDAFEGRVAFRRDAKIPETQNATDTPNANFQAADVAEYDFSSFRTSGRYAVAVDGLLRRPLHHRRLLPRHERPEHGLGHRPGAAPPRAGVPYRLLVPRGRLALSRPRALRPLAQGARRGPRAVGPRLGRQ